MADLETVVTFNGTDGANPRDDLIVDAAGNLYGTTFDGGASNDGTVYEIAATGTGYSATPTTLVSFDGTDGSTPVSGVIADASGDLFGTTSGFATSGHGTVYEIAKTAAGFNSAPTTLVAFNGTDGSGPDARLYADASGNLYGTTTLGGTANDGTVFEVANTPAGFSSSPTTLVSFKGSNVSEPNGYLIADSSGDLFGTTITGGSATAGTVFEIAKTATGYASTPTTLVTFSGTNGIAPESGLITDASGDLFGTTEAGGAAGDGTVFEIAKTATGYNSAPITLVSFNKTDGATPFGDLIADASGNLFGTTTGGGASNDGTVFEIAKTATGYSATPTTLVSFDATDGASPEGGLIADASGNLFGTADDGGSSLDGTIFEVTDSGFVVCFAAGTAIRTIRGDVAVEALAVGDVALTSSGECRPIRWLGRRTIDCRRARVRDSILPVCIAAHAFGPDRPARDLLVSPGHAICLDVGGEVLIPASALVNGSAVQQIEVDTVTYWHVELDSHDIILAENLPAESYLEMGNRSFFAKKNVVGLSIAPDAAERTRADFCRPFVDSGPLVEAVKTRLAARAAQGSRPSPDMDEAAA